jgi:ABC transporter substrate binding protein/Shikimate / quinate 5-dehydrogenase
MQNVSSQKILIVGGYGVVGTRIAAQLAPEYPGCLVIGGRNPERADKLAKSIGQGVRGRKIDITAPATIASALDDIAVVISCIDQPSRTLLWAAIERGLAYTDITPHLTELGRGAGYDKIDNASKQRGARIVLGTGIVPGISNVMVRSLSDMLGGADETNALGHKLVIANASTERDLESAFILLAQERIDALFVQVDPFFTDRRGKIAALAAQYSLPAVYALREFVDAGGLMSYGTSITDANRQLGVYTGQVLRGKKPADLPVVQSTKFELVLNLKTA